MPEAKIVAYDDESKPITEDDLFLESHREPLVGKPLNLVPPFGISMSDDAWEQEQLIEAVRERRRHAPKVNKSAR